ncbi:hypothetical protein GYMLUDRAFT_37498 [Collybiopsis luxurians FD-317 M1]|nr:hypothetical protein GYMLUDRAFT_37498 [Collybiopsis luxurians FD-317 M1]
MNLTTFNIFTFLFVLVSLAQAYPISSMKRDVFVPQILSPKGGESWVVGQTQSIIWNVSSPPAQITNPVGQILLRKGGSTQNVTLAGNFSILAGNVSFIVPCVTPDDDYSIILFGDSGNLSPVFSIVRDNAI